MDQDHIDVSDQAAISTDNKNKDQKEKVRVFRKRLQARDTFILPEVWDVASSRVMADAGFALIGTSALSKAWSEGLSENSRLALDDLVHLAASVAKDFATPVCADLEGIIGRSPDEIKHAVMGVVSAGCIGLAVGDGGLGGMHGIAPIKDMVGAIKAAKAAMQESRASALVIAKTEAFLLDPPQQSPFETAVERAEAYFEAGADCISIPGVQHVQVIERLSGQIDGPLGITIGLTPAPDVKALSAAGASLIQLGSALMRSLLGTLRFKAEELLAFGQFNSLDKAIPVEAMRQLLR